jgi:hypothetical protein
VDGLVVVLTEGDVVGFVLADGVEYVHGDI